MFVAHLRKSLYEEPHSRPVVEVGIPPAQVYLHLENDHNIAKLGSKGLIEVEVKVEAEVTAL